MGGGKKLPNFKTTPAARSDKDAKVDNLVTYEPVVYVVLDKGYTPLPKDKFILTVGKDDAKKHTKKESDGKTVPPDYVAIAFDGIKEAKEYNLQHERAANCANWVFPFRFSGAKLSYDGEKPITFAASTSRKAKRETPRASDPDLREDYPDFGTLKAEEPTVD